MASSLNHVAVERTGAPTKGRELRKPVVKTRGGDQASGPHLGDDQKLDLGSYTLYH